MKQAKKSAKTNVVAIRSKAKVRSGKLSATEQACADMEAKMQALHVQHTAFHTQYVERSNAALYALLADMERVCLDLLELHNKAAVIAKLRTHLKKDYGIKTQKNTSAVGVVVRYTLRNQRKTAHVYARALQTAIDAGVAPEQLADFIRERGGVDKIRQAAVSADERAAKRYGLEVMQDAFGKMLWEHNKQTPLGLVKWSGSGRLLPTNNASFSITLSMCDTGMQGTTVVGCAALPKHMLNAIMTAQLNFLALAAADEAEQNEMMRKLGVDAAAVENWQRANNLLDQATAKRLNARFKEILAEMHEANKAREAQSKEQRAWLLKLSLKDKKAA